MQKIILISLTSLLFCLSGHSQSKIEAHSEKVANTLKLDEFYFVHQLFSEAIYMTRLNKELSTQEMYEMLKEIYNRIDINNPVHVEIKRQQNQNAKLNFSIIQSPKGNVFVMKTNYDTRKNIFVDKIDDSTFMRFYIITGNRLIHNDDLYSVENENKAKQKEPYSLINFYMFDDKLENNIDIKPLIDKLLNNPKSTKLELLYTKLYLGEYYLMTSDFVAAKNEIENLKSFFDENKGKEIPKNYALMPDMAETEYFILKKFKE